MNDQMAAEIARGFSWSALDTVVRRFDTQMRIPERGGRTDPAPTADWEGPSALVNGRHARDAGKSIFSASMEKTSNLCGHDG